MLRVLLIILSVVAGILAYALGQPLLYLIALGLLAGSAMLTTAQMKKRHADVPESFMRAPEVKVEDLDSLGILEIRPRAGSSRFRPVQPVSTEREASGAPVGAAEEDPAGGDPSRTEGQQVLDFGTASAQAAPVPARKMSRPPVRSDDDDIVGEVRTKKPRVRIVVSDASPDQDADVLLPALRSLRAGLNAHTVCLLKQEDSPLRYRIEAIVSQNSYARNQGTFAAHEPMGGGRRPLEPLIQSRAGGDGSSVSQMGYYHEPISVRQVATTLVSLPDAEHRYFLVVDTMQEGKLDTESATKIMEQYARLVQTMLETPLEEESGFDGPNRGIKPRRDIIADEMQKARQDAKPLALALVFLNRGEEIAGAEARDIREMESAFETRLREIVDAGRVEKFGELTYGVFYRGDAETVASWASSLQTAFVDAEGHLRGGVSVGVALLNARHVSPDDLRSDATAALQEAFQTGACTIVE